VTATAGVAAAAPQEAPKPPGASQPEADPDRAVPTPVAVPTRDVFDLLRQLRHKPPKAEEEDFRKLMLAAAPVVGYNPASGLSFGVAGNAAFYKGYPETTELRTYVRLRPDARHRLALWLSANLVTGGTAPYFDLPATSMDTYGRSGRGYVQGRFRGQRLAYGEVEYRVTLRKDGLLGAVAFLNTQTFSNEQAGEELFDSFATGGGVGLRLMMNKRSRTNLAFDVGWGRDGANVYFAVQEAF
jgi:hypothetical protein